MKFSSEINFQTVSKFHLESRHRAVPDPRDRGKLGVHPRGAAGEEQAWQAGLRGTSGASTRRLLTTSPLLLELKAPVAAVLPTVS